MTVVAHAADWLALGPIVAIGVYVLYATLRERRRAKADAEEEQE